MANQLTQALLAAAMTALMNPILGVEPVHWNIFLAGMIVMFLNLDFGGTRAAKGSPLAHSFGAGVFIIYLAGITVYFICSFCGMSGQTGALTLLALGMGLFIRLIAELLTGEQIFTFPRNLRPGSWFRKVDEKSDRFWSAWGRWRLPENLHIKDSHMNAVSLGCLLAAIWLL